MRATAKPFNTGRRSFQNRVVADLIHDADASVMKMKHLEFTRSHLMNSPFSWEDKLRGIEMLQEEFSHS